MPSRKRKQKSSLGPFFYGLRYRIGEYALRSFVAALPWIPYRLLLLFTDFWAWVTFGCLWKYRTRMEENIAMALGQSIRNPVERKALVWRAWKNFARGVLATTAVMHFSKARIVSAVALEGEDHLKDALAKGKGVLALSAHLGSFTMIGARLAAEGYPFSAVVKQPRDQRFARLIDAYRAQIGIQTISAKPRTEAVRGILKALRKNRIVWMIADEFNSGGAWRARPTIVSIFFPFCERVHSFESKPGFKMPFFSVCSKYRMNRYLFSISSRRSGGRPAGCPGSTLAAIKVKSLRFQASINSARNSAGVLTHEACR